MVPPLRKDNHTTREVMVSTEWIDPMRVPQDNVYRSTITCLEKFV